MKGLKGLPPVWLRYLIIAVLGLGIFFRGVNLDGKVFWGDEVVTLLRISGYTQAEFVQQLPYNQVISIEELQKYQRPKPESNVSDTIGSLIAEDPLQPPLYFAIGRFWVDGFGSSPTAIRSLSVLLSLLVFPCLYWLCQELFESPLVGWIAIALFAISPFHVLYAQEARQYSLWTATILLSGAALLGAMRRQTRLSWVIYAGTTILGFYTHLFSLFVTLGQGIYVAIAQRCRLNKITIAYLLASGAAFLGFLPWLLNDKVDEPTWTAQPMSLPSLIKIWVGNITRIFFDLNFDTNTPLIYAIPPTLILLSLIGYAIYFLFRHTPQRIWLFILTLIGATGLALILPDVIVGGRRSSISRYLTPCYVGIQLAVAYLLATQMGSRGWQQKFWQVVTAGLISVGVVSCAFSSQANTWWHKKPNHYNPQIARIVNQAPRPLLISNEEAIYWLVSLSYLLEPKVQLQLIVDPTVPERSEGFSDVFLFHPSQNLRDGIEAKLKDEIKPSFEQGGLWYLEKS
ncbi:MULTISPECIES: glycosyltransferase family 39 protein [unclassified Coleofasciculus]|uniref:glycosyltransferase family 39 protein n=1 Tax=unclassified Coleofasciculus TaxID=2692782 RepID=UPI0018823B11|nr:MULTISPECIES: glycosyltransferase family 39 protein [unclassified Coleofasciculus]MBE9125737.1 glycosyltransferase family 39 protein [Coleofasciculus sp. LEGE 07081]MBE9147225.1 glycosyltransferase family 39 protein [Coleofasciculus sp. LEGE 07092]